MYRECRRGGRGGGERGERDHHGECADAERTDTKCADPERPDAERTDTKCAHAERPDTKCAQPDHGSWDGGDPVPAVPQVHRRMRAEPYTIVQLLLDRRERRRSR